MYKTALYNLHKNFGAKIIDFIGWEMPVQFEGIKQEHLSVRMNAGMFDVSYMGEIEVVGSDANEYCQLMTTNDINKLKNNKAQYSLLCNYEGGVVDDVIVYKISDERYFFCVNALNTQKVYKWFLANSSNYDVKIFNKSDIYSQFAIQGPNSISILNETFDCDFGEIKRFSFDLIRNKAFSIMIARTGYTGEDGFELFLPCSEAGDLWNKIYRVGEKYGLKFCGLGARDTLRIEMGYPLYGHEINEEITPLESGLVRFVSFDKGDFIGKEKLTEQLNGGRSKQIIGFEMIDRGIPRQGYKIFKDGEQIGLVTSGTLSPSLNKSVGIGLVNINENEAELYRNVGIEIRGEKRKAVVCDFPFYRK